MAAASDFLLFDPLCTSKNSVKENILKFCVSHTCEDDTRYVHPYDTNQQCVYEKKNETRSFRWETLPQELNLASLLNKTSDLSQVEDAVLLRVKENFANVLHLDFNAHAIVMQPLPEGQEIVECSVENFNIAAPPPIFVASRSVGEDYFDTCVFRKTEEEEEDGQRKGELPLHYNYRKNEKFPFSHSGDVRPDGPRNYAYGYDDSLALLQYVRPNRSLEEEVEGIVFTQAYQRKSFVDISHCDPNICLVDYRPESGRVNLYLIQFPLNKDFVKDSSICFIGKFRYIPREKKNDLGSSPTDVRRFEI